MRDLSEVGRPGLSIPGTSCASSLFTKIGVPLGARELGRRWAKQTEGGGVCTGPTGPSRARAKMASLDWMKIWGAGRRWAFAGLAEDLGSRTEAGCSQRVDVSGAPWLATGGLLLRAGLKVAAFAAGRGYNVVALSGTKTLLVLFDQ